MNDQIWSWVLGLVGVFGFILAGRKIWWAWYINIAAQILWFTYAVVTEQWGFFISAAVNTVVFTKNAIDWTKDRQPKKEYPVERRVSPYGVFTINETREVNAPGKDVDIADEICKTLSKQVDEAVFKSVIQWRGLPYTPVVDIDNIEDIDLERNQYAVLREPFPGEPGHSFWQDPLLVWDDEERK